MQVNQKNPYLKRANVKTPHKYGYDITTGKYFLITEDGIDKEINQIGTFKPHFRKSFTGFVGAKQRYIQAIKDPSALHYIPDLTFNLSKNYFCPIPDKFAGYSQFPYKLGNFPSHLQQPNAQRKYTICNFQHKKQRKPHPQSAKHTSNTATIDTTSIKDQSNEDSFIRLSIQNMSQAKPLPNKKKKSCYNFKCKYLQRVNFSQDEKISNDQTKMSQGMLSTNNTWGKSFHTKKLLIEGKESSLFIKKMV